jgi:hypothetical protein
MPKIDNIATPLNAVIGLDQQAFTTTTNGATVALKGLVSLAWFFFCNAFTSGVMTFKIQVSADGSTWVDLDEKYVIRPNAPVQITADNQIVKIGISGLDDENQKYARIVTLGTVVLSGCALAIGEPDAR